MKSLFPLAAAAALFIGLSGPASAERRATVIETIGHWTIQTNAGACEAVGEFVDGTTLSFIINVHRAALIAVNNPKWDIPKGRHDVVMLVDRSQASTFEADAVGSWVLWQVPFTEATMNLFSYGRTLRAKIGRAYVSYDLGKSEAAIASLLRCAAPRVEAGNPFSGVSPQTETPTDNPFAETASNPYRRM